ncbi:hypothetical protein J5N97_022817 [Dioscorea zingiberensis]|uniref:Uncharacterized protein n=1 Tax=Dioscorea zingiberensis TaxID=325984 RepID=A0A9D5CCQ2_9LILI|nr:hypothetical protein J5N97_022817 [Dioscorea zingiberensis]
MAKKPKTKFLMMRVPAASISDSPLAPLPQPTALVHHGLRHRLQSHPVPRLAPQVRHQALSPHARLKPFLAFKTVRFQKFFWSQSEVVSSETVYFIALLAADNLSIRLKSDK